MKKTTSLARLIAVLCAAAVLAVSASDADAKPRKVFLNGEDLGDVQVANYTFKGCTVRFDAQGNVYISAPNLNIKTKPLRSSRGKVPVRKALNNVAKYGRTFFLVSRVIHQGNLVPYRFSVYVNGKRVAIIDPKGAMGVHKVTHLIRRGNNTIRVSPEFRASAKITRSARDRFSIVLGAGKVDKGSVVIDNPVVNFERSGSETGKFTKIYQFTAR